MKVNTRKKVKLSADQIKYILDNKDISGQKIGERFGCSKQVIHRIRRENGVLLKKETTATKQTKTKSGLSIFEEDKRLIDEGRKWAEANRLTESEEIAKGLKRWECLPDGKTRILRKVIS